MSFENEHHYNEYMIAQAKAEAQYEADIQYYEYLEMLIQTKQFYKWKLETVIDTLNSRTFRKSGLSARDFFSNKLSELDAQEENINQI